MARKKTIQEIMRRDVSTFKTESELRAETTKLISAANKRLKRMSEQGVSTPASKAVEDGRFQIKGVEGMKELKKLFVKLRNFLQSETSTLRGYKKIVKNIQEQTKEAIGIELTQQQLDENWATWRKLRDANPWIEESGYKYKVKEKIDILRRKGWTSDEILVMMNNELEEFYEKEQEKNAEFEKDAGTSEYFIQ